MLYEFKSVAVVRGSASSNRSLAPLGVAARLALLLCCGWLLTSGSRTVFASATVEGNVLLSDDGGATFYADNPLTSTNEGIPTAGNSLNENQGTSQLNFEGRTDTKGTATIADDENVNFDIYVGRTSYGLLTINAGTELRDMNLIIGDSGMTAGSNALKRGSGYVRIENPGSLFNNDPTILPYPFDETGESPSINDRIAESGASTGFDLYVGRAGNGDLAISLGGRAEIQDAAIVGDLGGSVGTLAIDGVSSFLQSGGFETNTSDPNEIHYMIVGRLGSGTMKITNGGQSYNTGPVTTAGSSEVFAAVIGSNLAADRNPPGAGGQGLVEVDGIGSKWTTAGNLQVGGFHNNRQSDDPNAVENLDGDAAEYSSSSGRGTLRVTNGGLVSIVTPPLDENAASAPNRLDLLVGRFGSIELDGGRIELLGAFNSSNPQNPTQQLQRGRLINDGTVTGTGSISVLQFRNRVLGEVHVDPGQKLFIDATGGFAPVANVPVPGGPEYPLSNYGLIKVTGSDTEPAEIEFRHAPGTATELNRPFLNLPIFDQAPPQPGNGRTGGEIVGQNATMLFDSGIINQHKVSFTGGTNIVSGNFDNQGTVFIGGNDTTVTFIDQFFNNGVLDVQPNISLVMFIDDVSFGGSGSINTTFGGRPTGQEISHISSAEAIVLGGTLNASLFTATGVPTFSPQPGDRFEIISSATDLVGNFSDVNLPGCVNGLCYFGFPDYTLDSYFIQAFQIPAVAGPDLNGDGVVDDLDYNIWRQNYGMTGTPGTVPGDANGDGVVDAGDYTVWRDHCCGPFPGAGSGSVVGGGIGAGGSVPEPTGLALLACGGLLALALPRRK